MKKSWPQSENFIGKREKLNENIWWNECRAEYGEKKNRAKNGKNTKWWKENSIKAEQKMEKTKMVKRQSYKIKTENDKSKNGEKEIL